MNLQRSKRASTGASAHSGAHDTDTGGAPKNCADRRVGYVVSKFPAYSHAFIETEIKAVSAAGWAVSVFSLNRPDRSDPNRANQTFVVKTQNPLRWVLVVAKLALADPQAFVGGLREAIRSAGRRPHRRLRRWVWAMAYYLEALIVFDAARRRGIPTLHAHFANSGADVAWLAAEYGKRSRCANGPRTWSLTVHGPSDFDNATQWDLAGKVRAADRVVTISRYARATLMDAVAGVDAKKVSVVRMGVDFASLKLQSGGTASLTEQRIIRVLFVGRMVRKKGPHLIFEALPALASELDALGYRLRITFIGAGPELDAIRAGALETNVADVEVLGARDHVAVIAAYDEADIFCLPSFSEGLPVVLMEAMAAGLPVVTTTVAGIPELVSDNETGLLISPGDVPGLAGALARLAQNGALRERLGTAAAAAVRELHDSRDAAVRLSSLFEDLACSRR